MATTKPKVVGGVIEVPIASVPTPAPEVMADYPPNEVEILRRTVIATEISMSRVRGHLKYALDDVRRLIALDGGSDAIEGIAKIEESMTWLCEELEDYEMRAPEFKAPARSEVFVKEA